MSFQCECTGCHRESARRKPPCSTPSLPPCSVCEKQFTKSSPALKGAIIICGRSFNIHFSFSKIPLKVRIDRSSHYQILKYILASTFYCLSWNKGCIYFSFQNPSCHLCFGVHPLLPSGRPCCAIILSPKSCPYKHTLVSLSSSKQNKTLLWPISPFPSQNSWVNHLYTVSNLSPPIYSSTQCHLASTLNWFFKGH